MSVTEGIRLQKYLSMAGRASRREAERMLLRGRVRVNGVEVRELGTRVVPGRDRVEVDGVVVDAATEARWILFHKPAGYLTTKSDPHGGRTVYDALPEEFGNLKYLGRLDRDTEGLLVFTNQGDAINALLHPSGEVEREYRAWVAGTPTRHTLGKLTSGVLLEDGPARAKGAWMRGTEGNHAVVSIILTEGRKREVRRLFSAIGHPVQRLVRVRFGTLKLGELPEGKWRRLNNDEISRLLALAGDG